MSSSLREEVAKRFSIGPVVDMAFWEKERLQMDIDRGPCEFSISGLYHLLIDMTGDSPLQYMTAVAKREIAWISQYAVPRSPDDPFYESKSQNTPADHISLLEYFLKLIPYLLPKEEDILNPYLWHRDLHNGNIFVDESGHITSIIDWQSAWAGPLFTEARRPQVLKLNGEMMLRLPDEYEEADASSKTEMESKVESSILFFSYNVDIKKIPLLHKVLQYPDREIRLWPLRFAGDTWDEEILPFRESLIKIQK